MNVTMSNKKSDSIDGICLEGNDMKNSVPRGHAAGGSSMATHWDGNETGTPTVSTKDAREESSENIAHLRISGIDECNQSNGGTGISATGPLFQTPPMDKRETMGSLASSTSLSSDLPSQKPISRKEGEVGTPDELRGNSSKPRSRVDLQPGISDHGDGRRSTNKNHLMKIGGKRKHLVRKPLILETSHDNIRRSNGRRSHKTLRRRETAKATVPLPSHQYETILQRRAIRERESPLSSISNETSRDSVLDLYGDVSLGMKLKPVGGKIIVQSLIPLKDGRASPAQLSGCIQRGDVLLQINHRSLVNIPFDQLMLSLKPLSTPLADGMYPRTITLRFAAGQGLELLNLREVEDQSALRQRNALTTTTQTHNGVAFAGASAAGGNVDGAADVLGLFTMVDQMAAMPGEDEVLGQNYAALAPQLDTPPKNDSSDMSTDDPPKTDQPVAPVIDQPPQPRTLPLEEAISSLIAKERSEERDESDSEFFSWNNSFSLLLRKPPSSTNNTHSLGVATDNVLSDQKVITRADLLELGQQAFKGAQKLSLVLEKIDRGWTDRRSLRSFSATLTLYSKASTRRRYVLDGKAMPVKIKQVQEDEEDGKLAAAAETDEDSTDTNGDEDDGDPEELDADEMLVKLAAHDEVWREQVIEFLRDVVDKLSNTEEKKNCENALGVENAAVSTELGSFLFGDRMTKALMLNKKPQALPPDEITALLFDLTTKVSASVPDQIQLMGSTATVHSPLIPLEETKRRRIDTNAMLAARFLLDQVLPAWLQTFRPLPWDQRRVLWPLEKSVAMESTVGSTRSDDSITVDSMSTRQQHATSIRKPANLRELIEDHELKVETRSETCFLVTFYFVQKLLPQLESGAVSARSDVGESAIQSARSFVNEYGAYLRLTTCLSLAVALKLYDIITLLLEMGRHDPQHRESVRRFSRRGALQFYEPVSATRDWSVDSGMMISLRLFSHQANLSAVLERLLNIRKESDQEQRMVTIQLCASSYPDVRPWLVHRECHTKDQEVLDGLYYKYLSYLLHPTDGHEQARHDTALVMEWSGLSARGYLDPRIRKTTAEVKERKRNFDCVASRTSSYHLGYARDLNALLGLAVEVREYLVALDIGKLGCLLLIRDFSLSL